MQHYNQTYPSAPFKPQQPTNHYEQIVNQIDSLDSQNKKLIAISENIMKTSFIRQADQTPAVILQLEQDMKNSFNELIESIRQFFLSIDLKLKQLGLAIERKIGQQQLERSRYSTKSDNDKLEMLQMRIAYLEENFKKSHDNEHKLINILEQMNNKKQNHEEQPTIRKQTQNNYGPPQQSSKEENSFRLFSIGFQSDKNQTDRQLEHQPTYRKFQQYSNSPVIESMGPAIHQSIYQQSPQLFCVPPRSEQPRYPPKRQAMLRSSANDFSSQNSNKIHRLSNLLKGLKQ